MTACALGRQREEIDVTSFFRRTRKSAKVAVPTQVATTEPSADPSPGPTTVESFLGEVRLTAASFAPPGWTLCHGQSLPINQNAALFSLLGTTYGGDGRTTFGLPDLRGRTAVGAGQAAGPLPELRLGRTGTDESGQNAPDHGYLALNYIICTEGVFPART